MSHILFYIITETEGDFICGKINIFNSLVIKLSFTVTDIFGASRACTPPRASNILCIHMYSSSMMIMAMVPLLLVLRGAMAGDLQLRCE